MCGLFGPCRGRKGDIVAKATAVPSATTLMRNNVYGWFEKVETGVYALTLLGRKDWPIGVTWREAPVK